MTRKLDENDLYTLTECARFEKSGLAGIAGTGARIKRLNRLERMGLLEPTGYGPIEDCELERCRDGCQENHPCWKLTEAGRNAVEAVRLSLGARP